METFQRPTVLIVDDEPNVREVVGRRLRSAGLAPIEAASGEAALEELRRTSVDLVLLDLAMPGIGGEEVCRRIRSDATIARTPVLVLSGNISTLESRLRLIENGADGYLAKPFLPRELVAAVWDLVGRRPE